MINMWYTSGGIVPDLEILQLTVRPLVKFANATILYLDL